MKAGQDLGFSVKHFDKYGNLLLLQNDKHKLFFSNFSTPFNNQGVGAIARDKAFSHLILENRIKTPEFKFYFDPNHPKQKFEIYKDFQNFESIVSDIEKEFSFPVVIKKNRGEQGRNVFLCKNKTEAISALKIIFDYNSKPYDYVCVVEDYIKILKEYRVVCFDGKIVLCYLKDNSKAQFIGNLSPLHFKNAKAVLINDEKLISRLQEFIKPIFQALPIKFTGLDIAETKNGDLFLLEVNSQPMFKIAEKSFGEEPIVEMYYKILKKFCE